MFVLLLLLLPSCVNAVTNCGISSDPFFQTVSYNSKFDMWHAVSLVSEFGADGVRDYTEVAHHWETRSINGECIITRTVYIPEGDVINVYQQKILPAINNIYTLKEYIPQTGQFVEITDCQIRRIDAWTINVTSAWSLSRQLRVIEPHQIYHETVRTNFTETSMTVTARPPAQQNDMLKRARAAFEQGKLTETTLDPLPAFVYREE